MDVQRSEVVKIPYLDGLRGVAAMMVFMAHLMISLYPAVVTFTAAEVHTRFDMQLGLSPLAVLWRGNFAVCIFFVISGYVLSEFCQKTKISFPAQLVRRYFRLALPMLITSAFAWALLVLGAYLNLKAATKVTHSGWLSMWYRFDPNFFKMAKEALYGAFVNGFAHYNPNLWTMKIELIGSCYIFLLHVLFKNRFVRLFAILWLIKTNRHNYNLLFMWGALLYDHKEVILALFKNMLPDKKLRNLVVMTGFMIGVYLGAFPEIQPGMSAVWHTWFTKSRNVQGWHMLGAMLLVLFLLDWKWMQQLLATEIGRFLGKISFVLYLIHLPLICCVTAGVALLCKSLPYWAISAISAFVTFAVVIVVSAIIYRYVDVYTTSFSRWSGNYFDKLFPMVSKQQRVEREKIALETVPTSDKGVLECS